MFSKPRRNFSRISKLFRIAILVSLALVVGGILANILVMAANDGKMPVAMRKDDILFVIGPAEFGVSKFPSGKHFDEQHTALTEHTKFRILADRISVSFGFIHKDHLPSWVNHIFKIMKLPAGEDVIASPGDLCLWAGLLLAYKNFFLYLLWRFWKMVFRVREKM